MKRYNRRHVVITALLLATMVRCHVEPSAASERPQVACQGVNR